MVTVECIESKKSEGQTSKQTNKQTTKLDQSQDIVTGNVHVSS